MQIARPKKRPVLMRGFTLLELLLALGLALILSNLAAPAWLETIQAARLSSTVRTLHQAILTTRSTAIRRNMVVQLHAVNNDWQQGWQILDENGQLLHIAAPPHPGVMITSSLGRGLFYLAYDGNGHNRHLDPRDGVLYGHISVCSGKQCRLIMINALGHSRVCNPAQERGCAETVPG